MDIIQKNFLVKGERFMRTEEKPEYIVEAFLSNVIWNS